MQLPHLLPLQNHLRNAFKGVTEMLFSVENLPLDLLEWDRKLLLVISRSPCGAEKSRSAPHKNYWNRTASEFSQNVGVIVTNFLLTHTEGGYYRCAVVSYSTGSSIITGAIGCLLKTMEQGGGNLFWILTVSPRGIPPLSEALFSSSNGDFWSNGVGHR